MQVGQYTIEADQHSAWSKVFQIVGLPDLTSAEAKMSFKKSKTDTVDTVTLTHLSGIVFAIDTATISLSASQVDSLYCSAWYDLFINVGGEWVKIMEGRVIVGPSITDPLVI